MSRCLNCGGLSDDIIKGNKGKVMSDADLKHQGGRKRMAMF